MSELIKEILSTPTSTVCMFAGLAFLAIGIVGNISGKIDPGKYGRLAAAILGTALFVYGIVSRPGGHNRVFTAMEHNVNRPGLDIRDGFELPEARPELCEDACKKETDCKAYTYVRPGIQSSNAMCWLKSAIPAATNDRCCVSGRVSE